MRQQAPVIAPTRFERRELKYWLPEPVARWMLGFVEPFLRLDPALGGGAGERVTSLYLDTPRLDFYRWHLDSSPDRFKLRVRFYGEAPGPVAFFEVKRKVGSVVDKRRACVPSGEVPTLLEHGAGASPLEGEHAKHLRWFLYLETLHRAAPRLLVRCWRQALVSTVPGDKTRLTLDRHIAFQPVSSPVLSGDPMSWRPAPTPCGGALLELKFSGSAPWWMSDLARRLGGYRMAYSKYVAAMSCLAGEREGAGAEMRIPA
jgi:hypothetical protein